MKRNGFICFLVIFFISIFSGAYEKEASAATHVHTDACYDGHRHTDGEGVTQISGTTPRGCYTTPVTTSTTCYASLSQVGSGTATSSYTCPNCKRTVTSYCNTYTWRCSKGHTSSSNSNFYWSCSNCGYSGSYGGMGSGDMSAYPCYSSTTTVIGYKCTLSADTTPICDQVVTSILPVAATQTVYYNGSMDCTCNATFLDGHTATVSCTASGFNKSSLGSQSVTLTYSGLVTNAKTSGSLMATVNVTVVDYVVAISATSGTQSIYYGGAIVSTALITKASGGTITVPCTVSGFSNSTVGAQTVTLTYTGMTTNTGTYPSCTAIVTVLPGLVSITPTFSSQTIYKGGTPVLTATATYMDGSSKPVTPLNDFNSTAIGTQTVTLSYSDQGMTKTASCTVTVKPNLTNLTVSTNKDSVLYNTDIIFTSTAFYEDGSYKVVSSTNVTPYQKIQLGSQTVSYCYTENGITANAEITIVVLDYPTELNIILDNKQIYQTQSISIQNATITLASGNTKSVSPEVSSYDNMNVGNEDVTFSYTLNGVSVTNVVTIEVLADLYDLRLSSDSLTIYKGQDLDLAVYAEFNINGEVKLTPSDYTIVGFDNDVYDRGGKHYNLTYTDKGVRVDKTIFIIVLPNITDINATYPEQTTEGTHMPFVAKVTYEDGRIITLTEADIGKVTGLSIENYDINLVGYQDIIIKYEEGGITVSQSVNIRVRAIIRVSIPISSLISINSSTGMVYSSDLMIDNQSKESVVIGISSIDKASGGLNDVLPDQYLEWTKLGKNDSKNIAVGIYYASANWLRRDLADPLYIVEASNSSIGIIDKESSGSLEFQIKHGNSFETTMGFEYVIQWTIRLAEE